MEHGIKQSPSSPKPTANSTPNRLPKMGDDVVVMWDGYGDVQEWYRGRLMKQRGRRPFYFEIIYDDGDKQSQDLNDEHWHFVDDSENSFEPGEVEELRRELGERSFKVKLKKRPHKIEGNVIQKRRHLKPNEQKFSSRKVAHVESSDDVKILNALASASMDNRCVIKKKEVGKCDTRKCIVPVFEEIDFFRECDGKQMESMMQNLNSPVSVSYSAYKPGVDNFRHSNFNIDESGLEKISDISLQQVNNAVPYKKRNLVRRGQ